MSTDSVEGVAVRDAVRLGAATLHAVQVSVLACPALVAEFDRLHDTSAAARGTAPERAIDTATGRLASDLEQFLAFAKDAVCDRHGHATRTAFRAQVATEIQP